MNAPATFAMPHVAEAIDACAPDGFAGAIVLPEHICAAQWDRLAAAAVEPNVFAERWFAEASRHLAPPGLRYLTVTAGAQLVALMPVVTAPRYGRLPLRHSQNWCHYHSFLGTPLIRQGCEAAAWSAMLATLDRQPGAGALLHVTGLVDDGAVHRGLVAAAGQRGRPCDTVHRIERAMLASDLAPDAYYAATVRKKKRKELARLRARLTESGSISTRRLAPDEPAAPWIDAFLALEQAGWKGQAGSALGCTAETAAFFREVVASAHRLGRLDMLRIDRDGVAIAMLVNLLAPPGAFAFKTAFDETLGRFSPGVLIQLDNLQILARDAIDWVDSCAVENHPMINSLWGERRTIVRVSVPLAGPRNRSLFALARGLERAAARFRALHARRPAPDNAMESDA